VKRIELFWTFTIAFQTKPKQEFTSSCSIHVANPYANEKTKTLGGYN
jgi:hypothetical protein